MLLSSKNSAEDYYRQILESTEGICFLGTPHCGSQLADWGKIFTSVAKLVTKLNDSMVTVLQPESEVLARIQQEFHTMIRARNDAGKSKLRICCFYEDHDTTGIGSVSPAARALILIQCMCWTIQAYASRLFQNIRRSYQPTTRSPSPLIMRV